MRVGSVSPAARAIKVCQLPPRAFSPSIDSASQPSCAASIRLTVDLPTPGRPTMHTTRAI
jgi:hypothetical protein